MQMCIVRVPDTLIDFSACLPYDSKVKIMKILAALCAVAATAALTSGTASADEIFTLTFSDTGAYEGELIYETDLGDQAVMFLDDGSTRFYINGLGGQYSERGAYEGWFIRYDVPHDMPTCGSSATDHTGYRSDYWGNLQMIWFADDEFSLELAECNDVTSLYFTGMRQ